MNKLLNAAQMRTIEQAAMESGDVTGLELMERAGAGVVDAIFDEWPELNNGSRRAVVLCGPGNNGGDGFVVARLLKDRGWEVAVFLFGDPEKLPSDALVNYKRWMSLGTIEPISNCGVDDADVWIDAVFGIGLTRALPWEVYGALTALFQSTLPNSNGKSVAIDVPSFICSDSGRGIGTDPFPPEDSFHLTVSFQNKKIGHLIGKGPSICSKVVVVDIGVSDKDLATNEVVELVEGEFGQVETISKFTDDHKYSHGHALVLSGGPRKGGAARLAARGALRIGAGLVTVGCPPAALQENAAQLNAIMLRSIKGANGLRDTLADPRINALCIGPGLGLGENARELLSSALESKDRAIVFDADALTILAQDPALIAQLNENHVLTPHAGEFKRLFPDIHEKLTAPANSGPAFSKVDATREAAVRAGCTVLFKGPDTVIADPDGRASVNSAHYDRSAPWLATAGSGDVLAGFITGLLARGFAPMAACETAAWLHVECALKFGPGLIAEDLPEQLPEVFRNLVKID